MENQVIHPPKANELNQLEEIKRQAKKENNKEKYDQAVRKIKQIVSENPLPIDNNFLNLPKETQKSIIQIKINEAKVLDDDVAIEYWTRTLNSIGEEDKKNNQQNNSQQSNNNEEKKEEVKTHNSKQDNNEVERIKGKNSELIRYENGNVRITSDYLSLNVNSNNKQLEHALGSFLITLALVDLKREVKIENELNEILQTVKAEEDMNDLNTFIKNINIGENTTGEVLSQLIPAYVKKYFNDQSKKQEKDNNQEISNKNETADKIKQDDSEIQTRAFENRLYDVTRKKELLDMQLDELQTGKQKNPDAFIAMSSKYSNLIDELHELLHKNPDNLEIKKLIEEAEITKSGTKRMASMVEETNRMAYNM